jgi:hypothetical protein
MKRLLAAAAAAVAALAAAGAAQAGCMATVGLTPLPKGIAAGEPWIANVRVLQHGRTPMSDARPVVRIRSAAQGARLITVAARRTGVVGTYRARVVFPAAGRYAVAVYDGFPVKDCARVHTFNPVVVTGRDT